MSDIVRNNHRSLSPLSTDFLPLFVWVLVQCGFHRAEIEAEYMWGLAHPSLFNGEGGYYLTTLTSAVNVLKEVSQPPAQTTAQAQVGTCVYGRDAAWNLLFCDLYAINVQSVYTVYSVYCTSMLVATQHMCNVV